MRARVHLSESTGASRHEHRYEIGSKQWNDSQGEQPAVEECRTGTAGEDAREGGHRPHVQTMRLERLLRPLQVERSEDTALFASEGAHACAPPPAAHISQREPWSEYTR
jgi:hypothetical protein